MATQKHAATLGGPSGVFHGSKSYLLQDATDKSNRRTAFGGSRLSWVGPDTLT